MSTDVEKREKQEVSTTAAEQLTHSGTAYSPDVDIYAHDDELVLVADLPGVDKGGVTIEVDETDTLVIRARNGWGEPEGAVLRQYRVGDYYRAFRLSDEYDKDKVSAKLENGQLEVTIPRKESSKPRKIAITA